MLAKYGRGSILLQSPVTYQFEMECKTGFEFVTCKDLSVFLFDIVAIATNGKLFSSGAPHIHILPQLILLVVWSANDD